MEALCPFYNPSRINKYIYKTQPCFTEPCFYVYLRQVFIQIKAKYFLESGSVDVDDMFFLFFGGGELRKH